MSTQKTQTPVLHIGKTIRRHLEEVGMTKSEFARRISTSPQNVYGIFKRKSIDSELLQQISRCLGFDMFQYYSPSTMVSGGVVITASEMQKQIAEITKERDQLRKEVGYLNEIRELHKKK